MDRAQGFSASTLLRPDVHARDYYDDDDGHRSRGPGLLVFGLVTISCMMRMNLGDY